MRVVIAERRPKIVATVIAGTVQLGVENWMFSNIPYVLGSSRASRRVLRIRAE